MRKLYHNMDFDHAKAEIERLKAEVDRLKEALNKMTNTPAEAYGVDVSVNFWTKDGSRIPSSYNIFWINEIKPDQLLQEAIASAQLAAKEGETTK